MISDEFNAAIAAMTDTDDLDCEVTGNREIDEASAALLALRIARAFDNDFASAAAFAFDRAKRYLARGDYDQANYWCAVDCIIRDQPDGAFPSMELN